MKDKRTENRKGKRQIKIWQQNINKSRTCQHDLISSGKLIEKGIDIVALQEPAINAFNKSVASREWKAVYPSTHANEPGKTRTLLLIRDDLLTDRWEQLEFQSGDVMAIKLQGDWGKLTLFNIYNDCKHDDTIAALTKYHRTHASCILGKVETQGAHHLIWVGDFNRHHPYWDTPANNALFTREATNQAEILIQSLAEIGLEMALEAGVPTHEHYVTKRWSRLDHVFSTEHTIETITSCEVLTDEQGINTDHFPIVTEVDLEIATVRKAEVRNFRDVSWKEFREKLVEKTSKWGVPNFIRSQSELNRTCAKLTSVIQETIAEVVPLAKIGPHAKRWWSKELTELRQEMMQSRRKASKVRHEPKNPQWELFKEARRKLGSEIEKAKRNHWRDWLEKSSDPDLWTAHRYVTAPTGDGGKTRIPDLEVTTKSGENKASNNEEKSQMLAKTFFPQKPDAREESAQREREPEEEPICKADTITRDQIKRALARLKPYKAPGPDGIPNIVLARCADVLTDRLWYIYTAMWDRNMYYGPWKEFTTVVLRKPRKPKYNTPKAYRPIALLNTMGKVLTSIVAEQLTYYTEEYALLPPLHFGGRPARTTNDTLHYLTHRIKDSWRKKQVTSVLFLDIEGAFPNAVNKKLIDNMVRRRVPKKIVKFVENMLQGRTTKLKFDDHVSGQIEIDNGIGQGDPLSMILYQYYNADLLDIPAAPNEAAAAYVDDAILVATARTFEETHNILEDMMTRAGGAIDWAKDHNSNFEFSKLALMDFAHRNKRLDRPPLRIGDTVVEPTTSTKYLGIYLNQHLNWKEQQANAAKKGAVWASQIRRLVRPGWGLTPKYARRLYTSVAVPRILYGVDVWAPPTKWEGEGDVKQRTGNRHAANCLTSAQRPGTLAILGGLRTSPSDSLCAHANVTPMPLEIEKHCGRAALRMATLPAQHPLTKAVRKCAKKKIIRHRSSLHHLGSAYGADPDNYETIQAAGRNPAQRGKEPFKVFIPSSKEDSKIEDAQAPEHIKIYSDGSAHDGKVGAAAIMIKDGKTIDKLHFHLGKVEEHTVFKAELVGILLGLQLIKERRWKNLAYAIGVDNQAAIKSLASKLDKPGHYLAAEILNAAAKLKRTMGSRYSLSLRWTAGHIGIPGNEDVDEEAKAAAEGLSTEDDKLPKTLRKPLKISRSAARQQLNGSVKMRWENEWKMSPRYTRLKHIDSSLPSHKFVELMSSKDIRREAASKTYQLRSGHIPLNAYLHRFKLVESAQCPACGAPRETPQHFVLECPAYEHERRKTLKPKRGRSELKYAEILGRKNEAVALAHFIMDTRRFDRETQEQHIDGKAGEGKRNGGGWEAKSRRKSGINPSRSSKT